MELPKLFQSKKPFEFYEVKRLINKYPECKYYVIFGERSNGKTYSALSLALERYVELGEQFAYIRRFGLDIQKAQMETLFDGHAANGFIDKLTDGMYTGVDYTGRRFRLVNRTEESRKGNLDEKPCGWAFDLAAMERYKSTSFPNVTTIIFDEFMSRTSYLPNEFTLFVNVLSTIIRNRSNVKVFLLGNTVNRYCPYFQEMGLSHVKEQQQGTIDIYHYGQSDLSVAVEYCESSAKRGGKESDVYFAFENPHLDMITSGGWELAIYPRLPYGYQNKDVVESFFVSFTDDVLRGKLVQSKEGLYLVFYRYNKPIFNEDGSPVNQTEIIYASTHSIYDNVMFGLQNQDDNLSRIVRRLILKNKIFFDTNMSGEVLRNYLLWGANADIRKN